MSDPSKYSLFLVLFFCRYLFFCPDLTFYPEHNQYKRIVVCQILNACHYYPLQLHCSLGNSLITSARLVVIRSNISFNTQKPHGLFYVKKAQEQNKHLYVSNIEYMGNVCKSRIKLAFISNICKIR